MTDSEITESEMTENGHLNINSNGDNSPSSHGFELNLPSSFDWFVMHVVWRIRQCGEPGARARS